MSISETKSTKERLFLAAMQVFAEKGFKEATVREICQSAGSANINSINYYFGSKGKLYNRILEIIFSEYDRYEKILNDEDAPEDRLRYFIHSYCKMLYQEDRIDSHATTILFREMARPSGYLNDLIDQYNKPRTARNLAMIREILGPIPSDETVRDCLISIGGQILYFSYAWPLFSRLFPEHPGIGKVYEQWADHVFCFSMGGLESIKKSIRKSAGINPA